MNRFYFSNRAWRATLFLSVITLVVMLARADAAFRVARPIAIGANSGYILQTHL